MPSFERERPTTAERERTAAKLMMSFAERTGLTSAGTRQRYLWTDAFAVCNFLGLAQRSGEERYLELALELVDQGMRGSDTRGGLCICR